MRSDPKDYHCLCHQIFSGLDSTSALNVLNVLHRLATTVIVPASLPMYMGNQSILNRFLKIQSHRQIDRQIRNDMLLPYTHDLSPNVFFSLQHGRTVMLTIHQPSFRILELLSSLLVMAGGRCVYHGPIHGLFDFFEQINMKIPEHVSKPWRQIWCK